MVNALRILLISLVTASPLLAWVQLADATSVSVAAISAPERSPFDGSHAADAGFFEECDEDGEEEEQGRVEHGSAALVTDSRDEHPGRFAVSTMDAPAPVSGGIVTLSRGPPSRS